MSRIKRSLKIDGRWVKAGALGFLLMISVATILYLGLSVSNKIQSQTTAASDNVQWTLAQMEVEYLSFKVATQDSLAQDEPDLKFVRTRFDILYGRVSTIAKGKIYADLRNAADFNAPLLAAQNLLDQAATIIDLDDETLTERLPELDRLADGIRPLVRQVALIGITHFAKVSDATRLEVLLTLSRVAGITIALVMALIILALVLFQLYRVSQLNSLQNKQTSARLQAMVSSTLDAVIVIDETGRIVEYNGAAETIFGFTRDEAMEQPIVDLIIPPKYRKAHMAGMKRYQKEHTRRVVGRGHVQLEAMRKNGEIFPCEFSIAEAKAGNRQLFVSFLRDISRQVQNEEELLRARDEALAGEKAKADLLAVMSHEMRTPLNGILGTIELMRDSEMTDQQKYLLRIMETSGNLLLHHVNDVLDVSRLDAGPVQIAQAPFALAPLLTELLDSQKGQAQRNNDTIEMEIIGAEDATVLGDQIKLRQILLNLTSNAIKFTHNGVIRLEVERHPSSNEFEFRVIDTGIGITEEDLARIFDDFVTLDTSYSRVSGGTGLGLGIAKRLVEAMGGEIGAESERGEGSLFWFRIPLPILSVVEPTSVGAGEEFVSPSTRNQSLNILVVEDNQINRLVVQEMLVREGHQVTLAHDGLEGTEFADREHFDLILMDISMPKLDGVEAAQRIRGSGGKSSGTRIIALTAHALPADIERFQKAGMDDALIKPITRQALNDLIQSKPSLKPVEPVETKRPMPSQINAAMLNELAGDLGVERVAKLVRQYIEETETILNEIYATVESAPDETLIANVHKMAGSSAMFGADSFANKLRWLETLGKTGKAEQMRYELPDLRTIWKNTRVALEVEIETHQHSH